MKILLVTPFLPYSEVGHAGGKIVYDFIKILSVRHEIHLLARGEPAEVKYLDELKKYCANIEIKIFKTPKQKGPVQTLEIIASYILFGLKTNRTIKKNRFDIIQIEFIETGLAVRPVASIPMIITVHDVISKVARRRYLSSVSVFDKIRELFWWKMTVFVENFIVSKFKKIFVFSNQERNILFSNNPRLDVSVIRAPAVITTKNIFPPRSRERYSILFIAAMFRDANVIAVTYFYNNIYPMIKEKIPELKFYLVGNKPAEKIKLLAKRDKNVIVTGYVNDPGVYFSRCSVFVSPIVIGGGIIMKNINAMAAGLPVVTTSIGNEGIEAVPGRDLLVSDEPEEFAKNVVTLLNDDAKYKELAIRGRNFVLNKYNTSNTAKDLENSYKKISLGERVG